MSISCTDYQSPAGGAFELQFSQICSKDGHANINPHHKVEAHLRPILRHDSLVPSLHRLVTLLRDSLPIVAELEKFRQKSDRCSVAVDTFAKSAGWFRVIYGDMR